jgi:hypothetical protein
MNFIFNLILTIMSNNLIIVNGIVMTIADFQQLDKA